MNIFEVLGFTDLSAFFFIRDRLKMLHFVNVPDEKIAISNYNFD